MGGVGTEEASLRHLSHQHEFFFIIFCIQGIFVIQLAFQLGQIHDTNVIVAIVNLHAIFVDGW